MGAVLNCGPKKGSMRYALVAIADNSDDYGFACPSIETIAEKACCDARTAMRLVQALERDGWMRVVRRVLFGKGSVYFIDIAKLGVTVNPKMRKSPLHGEVEKQLSGTSSGSRPSVKTDPPAMPREAEDGTKGSGDNLSRENLRAPENSGDNPQGSQVTKEAESGDKKPFPILSNRCEPLLNPDKGNNPLPPSQANGECVSRTASENGAKHCHEAVRKVMRELNLTERRMERVIAAAIVAYRAKTDAPLDCNAVAELMIRARNEYLAHAHLLKCQSGPRKFFALGMWADERLWVVDRQAVREQRRL